MSRESGSLSKPMAATKSRMLRRSIADGPAPQICEQDRAREHVRMAFLIEPKAQVLYITASSITVNGKKRKIVIESRPEYAVISLQGQKKKYPILWEHLFQTAVRHLEYNLRVEAAAEAASRAKGKSQRK